MGIIDISDPQEWENQVMQSPVPVFVDFWAEWCGPCRMVGPVVEELAGEYDDDKVKFVKVNVDNAGTIASQYQVFSIPTLIVFKGGKAVDQKVGAGSKDTYKSMIDKAL